MENIIHKVEVPDLYRVDGTLCSHTLYICEDSVKCVGGKNQEYLYIDYDYRVIGFVEATRIFPYALIVFGKNDDYARNEASSLYSDKRSICFNSKRTDIDELNEFAKTVLSKIKEAIKEAASKSVILTTTDDVIGYEIKEYIGLISGTDIYLVGGLVGGGLVSQEKLFHYSLDSAKDRLLAKARDLNADAVVAIKQSFTSPGNLNSMILVLMGTAVKLKKNKDLE